LGITQHLLGKDGDAAKALMRAVDLNTEDPRSYSFLAVIDHVPVDLMPSVTDRFEAYARQHPRNGQAQLLYATNLWRASEILNRTEDIAKIESLLKAAVSLDPKLADAHTQLGILYARRGENNRAAAEFEQTIRLDPAQAPAHYHLAQALIHLGQKQRGEQELELFRKLHAEQKEEVVVAFLMAKQDQPR
jgi:cytochrome c-type biogenesis protein CcmH/NrfG